MPELRAIEAGPGAYAVIGSVEEAGPANQGVVGNAGFIVGERGSIAINAGGSYRHGLKLLELAEQTGNRPVVLAILTQPWQECLMGAAACAERGIPVLAHAAAATLMAQRCETCLRRLKLALGEAAMAGTRVLPPTLTVTASRTWSVAGRRLRLLHEGWGATSGDLAVYDPRSAVLYAGALASHRRIPDLRDAEPAGFLRAAARLARVPARRVVPGYGALGEPREVFGASGYVRALEAAVAEALSAGMGLNQALREIELPAYAGWALYDVAHPRNVQRMLLLLEQRAFRR